MFASATTELAQYAIWAPTLPTQSGRSRRTLQSFLESCGKNEKNEKSGGRRSHAVNPLNHNKATSVP